MENAFENVKIVYVSQRTFTDKTSGEKKTYYAATSQSSHNEFFIFNVYDEVPEVGQLYGMFCEPDNYLKAKIKFKRVK